MKAELNMKLKSKKFVKRETEAEPKPQNELFEVRGTDMATLPRLHLVLLVGTGTENRK